MVLWLSLGINILIFGWLRLPSSLIILGKFCVRFFFLLLSLSRRQHNMFRCCYLVCVGMHAWHDIAMQFLISSQFIFTHPLWRSFCLFSLTIATTFFSRGMGRRNGRTFIFGACGCACAWQRQQQEYLVTITIFIFVYMDIERNYVKRVAVMWDCCCVIVDSSALFFFLISIRVQRASELYKLFCCLLLFLHFIAHFNVIAVFKCAYYSIHCPSQAHITSQA